MFVTLVLLVLKLKVRWVFEHSSESALLKCLDFMCNIYVQCYNKMLYGTMRFDITHRILTLKSISCIEFSLNYIFFLIFSYF